MKTEREPEEQERKMIQSKQVCYNLAEEQHLVSSGSKDPETNLSELNLKKKKVQENLISIIWEHKLVFHNIDLLLNVAF